MYALISIYNIHVCKPPKKNRKHGTSFAKTRKYELYIKKNSLVTSRSKQLNLHVTTEIQRGPLARVYYIVHKHMMKNDIVLFGQLYSDYTEVFTNTCS